MSEKPLVIICAATFHKEVKEMVEKAKSLLLPYASVECIDVRGCFELPLAVLRSYKRFKPKAIITLGAIEKGETGHGFVMAQTVFKELTRFSLENDIVIGIGVIGPSATHEQIIERAIPHAEGAVEVVLDELKK